MKDVKEFYAKDRQAWRQWLAKNHDKESSVWLVYDKGPNRTLKWPDIVQEAICFGWIDSVAGMVSDTQSKLYIAKRKPTSGWSKINKAHVEVLEKQGTIMPAGRAAIEQAKQNGAWDKLNKSDNLELPPELIRALEANPQAKQNFDAFTDSGRRIILEWLYSAKLPETIQKRITKIVADAEQGKKAFG